MFFESGIYSRMIFLLTIGAMALELGGCTVGYPKLSDVDAAKTSLVQLKSIDDARAYVDAVRRDMESTRDTLQVVQSAADIGVIGGGVAALAGGLLGFSSHFVIRSALVAGTSLAVGQTLALGAQMDILNQGLGALSCVEDQTFGATQFLEPLDVELQPVRDAVQAVEAALPNAITLSTQGSDLETHIQSAYNNLAAARKFLAEQESPITGTATVVRLATNFVVDVTNKQLRLAQPDPAAFQKAIQSINITSSTGAGVAGTPSVTNPPSPKAVAGPEGASPSPVTVAMTTLDNANKMLAATVASVAKSLSSAGGSLTTVAAILSTCQGSLPTTVIAMTITPMSPIKLKVGATTDYTVAVTGGKFVGWNGPTDSDVSLTKNTDSTVIMLRASKATTSSDNYGLVFQPTSPNAQQVVLSLAASQ